MNIKEAAVKLGVSPDTVRRYIRNGKLKAEKVGRAYHITEDDLSALLPATLAPGVDDLVSHALETNEDYLYGRRDVAFRQAEQILRDRGETTRADQIAMDALIFSFVLTNLPGGASRKTSQQRFSPRVTGTDGEGNAVALPDPTWIDEKVVAHAKMRADTVRNPITKAIYCDLVYEFSRSALRPEYGTRAAETYLLAADVQPGDDEVIRLFVRQGYILRALELSLALKNDELVRRTTEAALRTVETLASADNMRMGLEIIGALLRRVKQIGNTDTARISALIDTAATHYFAEGNEHLGRSFVELKLLLPAVKSDADAQMQVKHELFDSFMREGKANAASGLVASTFYAQALKISGGVVSPVEQAALRRKIEEANLQSVEQMQSLRYEFEVTDAEIKKFVATILVDDLDTSFRRIAIRIPRVADAEQLAKELLENYPLAHLFSAQHLQDGRVVAITPGGIDLTETRTLEQYGRFIEAYGIELGFLFEELVRRGLNASILSAYLSKGDLFSSDIMPTLSEALENYFDGRYYSTVVVLLTQLERLLREVNRRIGRPTMRAHDSGEQRVIYLEEALASLKDAFDAFSPDAYQYFAMILFDKRGLDLRNTTAHGLLEFADANKLQAQLLIHLLLILAQFRYQPRNEVLGGEFGGGPEGPTADGDG